MAYPQPPICKLGLFLLVWYLVAGAYVYTINKSETSARCIRSEELVAVLQYLPYKVRASDLAGTLTTINKRSNVQLEFFETDGRTYNRFRLAVVNDSYIEGETNWIGFRATLNDPREFLESCLLHFNGFSFK